MFVKTIRSKAGPNEQPKGIRVYECAWIVTTKDDSDKDILIMNPTDVTITLDDYNKVYLLNNNGKTIDRIRGSDR